MRKGEQEVLAAVARRFEEKQQGYVLSETEDGYAILATEGGLRYLVSHQTLGWSMHLEVTDDGVFSLDMSESQPFQELWDDLNEVNARYYLDSEEVQAFIKQQRVAIEQALFPYSRLIARRSEDANRWHYELKVKNGQAASFTILFHPQEKYWDVDLDGFMNEYHFRTDLYDLQEAIYNVLDDLNRLNVS